MWAAAHPGNHVASARSIASLVPLLLQFTPANIGFRCKLEVRVHAGLGMEKGWELGGRTGGGPGAHWCVLEQRWEGRCVVLLLGFLW